MSEGAPEGPAPRISVEDGITAYLVTGKEPSIFWGDESTAAVIGFKKGACGMGAYVLSGLVERKDNESLVRASVNHFGIDYVIGFVAGFDFTSDSLSSDSPRRRQGRVDGKALILAIKAGVLKDRIAEQEALEEEEKLCQKQSLAHA